MRMWLVWIAMAALQAQQQLPSPTVPESYQLGPGDQINISISGQPKFAGTYTIRPDGRLMVQLIGEVQVAGLTQAELEGAINHALSKELENPRSTVNVLALHSKHIYFDGDGITPGAMELVTPMHLLEALTAHGCCLDSAKTDKIQILRNGKTLTTYFSYQNMLNGKGLNPLLQVGDHVIVP